MCLLHPWNCGPWVNAIVPWLSLLRLNGQSGLNPSSQTSIWCQMTWHVVCESEMYSASSCNNQFPWRQKGPQGPADLGSAIGLAPQSPGLLGGLRDGTGVSQLIFQLRKVHFLSMGIYIHDWGSHESDFHNVTRYGSKMCHTSVTGVTCDTTRRGS